MSRWAPNLVIGFSLLMIAAAAHLPVAYDEAYYWTWSRALAPVYLDHPPGVAFLLAGSEALLGPGLPALRAPALLASALTALFGVLAAGRLAAPGHEARARGLALLTLGGSLMFTLGQLPATPDPFQSAALAGAAYLVVRAAEPGARAGFAAAAAFVLVAGVLLKQSSALVAAGAFAAALAHPEGRQRLRAPAPWFGAALGALALAPWLSAELASGGATSFQWNRVVQASSPRGLLAVPLVFGAMLLVLGPGAAVLLAERASALLRRRLALGSALLAGGALGLLLGCVAAAWSGTGEVNWVMPALAFGLPAVAARAAALGSRLGRLYAGSTAVAAGASALLLGHVIHPFLPFPPAKDRTLREAGYDELARAARALAEAHGAAALITRRYQLASVLRFHLEDALPVHELGTSRPSQLDRWPRPRLCAGDVAVVVLPGRELQPELQGELLEPTRLVERRRGSRSLGAFGLTALRLSAPLPRSEGCPAPAEGQP